MHKTEAEEVTHCFERWRSFRDENFAMTGLDGDTPRDCMGTDPAKASAHASRNSVHDGESERKRGLVTVVHRVNCTIFAALCVGFRGRFPWPRKVSVVRREQIRVLIKTAPLPVHPRCGRPLVGGYAQTAAEQLERI